MDLPLLKEALTYRQLQVRLQASGGDFKHVR